MLKQIAHGLRYLQSNNKVHRDIKAENILCDSAGNVKISDFGLTKQLEEEDLTKTFCGTKSYMSPERLKGEKHGFSSDIWSLGITIHFMATGELPFASLEFFSIL